jgi:hypothetical protein
MGAARTVNNAATATECVPVEGRSHEVDGTLGIDNSFGHNLFPLLDLALRRPRRACDRGGAVGPREPAHSNPWLERHAERLTGTDAADAERLRDPQQRRAQPPDIHVIGSAAFLDEAGTMPAPLPIWDGTDYFWGRDDTFAVPSASPDLDAATPLVVDNNAYVANGILVTTVPDGTEIILVGDGLGTRVRLSGMIATAEHRGAEARGRESTSTVTIAGRWGFNDLLRTAESVGVCPGSRSVRHAAHAGERHDSTCCWTPLPGERRHAAATRCRLGITFEAYPANVGGVARGSGAARTPAQRKPRPERRARVSGPAASTHEQTRDHGARVQWASADLLGQVELLADLTDDVELRLEPVDAALLVLARMRSSSTRVPSSPFLAALGDAAVQAVAGVVLDGQVELVLLDGVLPHAHG